MRLFAASDPASEHCVAKKANRQNPLARRLGEVCRGVDRLQKLLHKLLSDFQSTNRSTRQPVAVSHNTNPFVAARDVVIRNHRLRSSRKICEKLDSELEQRDAPTMSLPEPWMKKHGVRTFSEAYKNAKLRPLVQKMICDSKKR
jgi:hypothetical protein